MSIDLSTLLDRRLLIVVGKGGVGKTTVACALARAAAACGKRTLLVEVDGIGRAAALLDVPAGALQEAQHVDEHLAVMSIEGSAALAEYLGMLLPVKRLLQRILDSQIYQYFVAAAPGLKELMTIGKIWYEAERPAADGTGRQWDVVVMDAPATGHGLQYLGMPKAAHDIFKDGLVGRESQRLLDLLTDPERTAINLVTTAEEMPVNETLEMYQRITTELHMPLGGMFVNRLHTSALRAKDMQQLQSALRTMRASRKRKILHEVYRRGQEEIGWTTINQTYLKKLQSVIDMPLIEIPFLFRESFGTDELNAVMEPIAQAITPSR